MSILVTAKQARRIGDEHSYIVRTFQDPDSPYIAEMERYYVRNRTKFRSKIMMATWIPKAVKSHMIRHVEVFLAKRRIRTKGRARALTLIKRRSDVEKVSFAKNQKYWQRDSKGRIYLKDSKTNRFLHTTDKEKRLLRRSRR